MPDPQSKPVTILMAEDDEGHATLIRSSLARSGVINPIVHFHDGQEILDFLRGGREGPQPGESYLLLLDIQMPKVDGVEVLRELKSDPVLKNIPVIMLTTTDDPREVQNCYELGCNLYITKPVDFQEFMKRLASLGMLIQVVVVTPVRDPDRQP